VPKLLRSEFRPLPPQKAFLRSQASIRGYGGAVGGGKIRTGCEEIFNACLDHPGIVCLVARDAHTSIVETTKKTMLNQVIPAPLIAHRKASQGEDFVELFNGSRIHFIGMDNPYRWYSSEVGYIFFDESQELVEEDVVRLMNRCGRTSRTVRRIRAGRSSRSTRRTPATGCRTGF
jgi:phage terminase large subunit